MQASFREILEKKLNSPLENDLSQGEKSQFSDPFALSFLMGSIPQFKYKTGHYQNSFTKTETENSKTSKESAESTYTVEPNTEPPQPSTTETKAEPIYSMEALSVQAVTALYVLKSLGANLDDSFYASELKKQYRRLLLRYHPDHNDGSTLEEFFDLRQAYDSIISELDGI